MSDNSLVRQSARELARLIRTRAVSSLDVLDAHLAAIKALNPKLNAVVTLAEENARDNAQRAEQAVMKGEPIGALHGLPIGIKDITQTAGIRTTFASPLLKDNVPSEDEEVVRRLKAAGAIVLAKTNTPEFACGANTNNALFGPTRNPWNPALSPAGSSGGSAVAVATGMTPLAQGTDYGCSIRIPAAFCGIVGIRPTPGPDTELSEAAGLGSGRGARAAGARCGRRSPDARCHGWLQPHFADLGGAAVAKRAGRASNGARTSRACASPMCPTSPASAWKRRSMRFAATPQPLWASSARMSSTSHSTPAPAARPIRPGAASGWSGRQYERLAQIEGFGPNLKGNVEAGLKLNATDYAAAEQTRMAMFDRFHKLFERYDVLLTPAAPVKPYPVEMNFPDTINGKSFENYIDWIAPAYLITLVSLPAATAPAGLSQDGLPVGMQIVAPRFEEPLILRVARLIHRASNVGRPPIAG